MKIVVCTKQTPSTTADLTVDAAGSVSWEDPGGKPNVINPWDEYSIEEGIRLKENHGATDVIAMSLGGEDNQEALKTALAMGCTDAILLSDAAFAGADTLGTAKVLAAAVNHRRCPPCRPPLSTAAVDCRRCPCRLGQDNQFQVNANH